jgi:hypothetical protein
VIFPSLQQDKQNTPGIRLWFCFRADGHNRATTGSGFSNETDKEGEGRPSQWQAKAQVLMEMFEHHVVEEEGTLFQEARESLDVERARAMVGEFETERKRLAT